MIHPLRAQFEKVLRPVYNHVIGGRHPAVRGDAQYMPVECKYTGKSVARVVLASGAETQRALEEPGGAICWEVGKPMRDAVVEVGRAVDTFTIAAEEAVRRQGEYAPLDISARNASYSMLSASYPVGDRKSGV